MVLSAASLRRSGTSDLAAEQLTEGLLKTFDELIGRSKHGHKDAIDRLESQLLVSQQVAHLNPYVSCTHDLGVALSFALKGGTPGFVLRIESEDDFGIDFEQLRQSYRLFGDSMDYLQEYGIPRKVGKPFEIVEVLRYEPRSLNPLSVL